RVQATQVEPAKRGVTALRLRAGLQLPEGDVHRYPAVGRQVELAPVVDVVVTAVGEDGPGLPARRYPVHAQQGDQQQGLLAAIAVTGMQGVVADVGKGRVFARAGPRYLVDRGKQLLRDPIRIGLVADDLAGEHAHGFAEHHVRQTFGHVWRERGGDGIGYYLVGVDGVVLRVKGEFVGD